MTQWKRDRMAKQQPINLNQLSSYHQQAQTAQSLKHLGDTIIRAQELTGMAQLVAHFPAELPAWQAVYVDYAVPIERLQAFTSLDFYPNLPDSTEQRMEREYSYRFWFGQ